MDQVLIITLGPVQDFIFAARRCRDLWFGSWLLSELSKAVARGVAQSAALVFPGAALAELKEASDTSVANKIVALVPAGVSPESVARQGREALDRQFDKIRGNAFQKIASHGFLREVAESQVADLIEYMWASAPAAADYAAGRRAAETLLGARKNTRLWDPVPWGAEVPKSSIDGERESVLREELYDELKKTPELLRTRYGVGAAERLCGVGLLKRHGTRDRAKRYSHHFLSTGHLAAWPLLERMEGLPAERQEKLRALWRKFLERVSEGRKDLSDLVIYADTSRHPVIGEYDGGLLFENRVPDLFEDEPDEARRRESTRLAREALGRFMAELGGAVPNPYYAILVADGDRMGKAIEHQTTQEGHKDLSQALDGFARGATEIVESLEHRGELIYAGGDDVLAFVPLHRVLDCATSLARSFRERLAAFPAGDTGDATPTLSVGIGISHFFEPMGRALALARRAESLAKQTRNALAVMVDKRSGAALATRGSWDAKEPDLAIDAELREFVRLHREDWVPDGVAHELSALARLLPDPRAKPDPREVERLESLVRKEAERILRRKQPQHGEQAALAKETLDRLLKVLDQKDGTTAGIDLLAERLLIAKVLAEAALEAQPLTPGGQP